MKIWCGIDWAEHHHDIAVVDEAGKLLTKRRIGDDLAGFRELLDVIAELAGPEHLQVPVAMETANGLLAASLLAAGFALFAINPLAVSRYRDRYSPSRAKSDAADAYVLANILRTDPDTHRRVPADTEHVRAIRVLARAQQDAVWDRQHAQAKLRSLLREYYPAFLATFPDLADRDARAALAVAPSPAAAASLRRPTLRAALARNGRQRNLDQHVERIVAGLRAEHMRQPVRIEAAMAAQALAHLRSLDVAVANALTLEGATAAEFDEHADAAIITSMPGLGSVLGARVLAELGDDRARFADAKSLKAFAGTAPVTRASGLKRSVTRRIVRNKRLGQAGHLWAFSLLTSSPGARAHYDRRRAAGDSHNAAARNLANRYFGLLHHCLQSGAIYDEASAYPPSQAAAA
jgi:transposase